MSLENTPIIRKTLLPRNYYEHDTGDILYAIMSPVELPYRAFNFTMDAYYHITGTQHKHQ